MTSIENKKLAKNTLFLYLRQLIVMAVSLYTSRIILNALGFDEYGVYSLVGGIAFSFGFFSSSLSNATQRFLSFAHGKGLADEINKVFNSVAIVYLIMGGSTILLGCLIGPTIINHLNMPINLRIPAIWVYYCTILSLGFTLTATMYDSVIVSRENMRIYAYISIADASLKLLIAFIILHWGKNNLILYAILLLFQTILTKGFLIFYCIHNYAECSPKKLYWDKGELKELSSFIGWNGLSTVVFAINAQGTNFLLNIFFGPIVNAARGIAQQVDSAITTFSNNFFLAISPQIIKAYSANNRDRFISLFFNSGKYSFFLLWMLFLPIIFRRDYILHLWLKNVPDFTSSFLLWIIIFSLISVFHSPQWAAVRAIGKLKMFVIVCDGIYLLIFPISWLLLKLGCGPLSVMQTYVVIRVIYLICMFNLLHKKIEFSRSGFFFRSVMPALILSVITATIMYIINPYIPSNFLGLIIIVFLSIILNFSLGSFIMLSKKNRSLLYNKLISRIQH